MSIRSTDTVESGEPHETGESVEIEFSEFNGQSSADSAPVSSPEAPAQSRGTQRTEEATAPLSAAPPDWFRSVRRILQNDPGAQFRLTIRNSQGTTNVSTVTAKLMTFHRPDGSIIQREAAFYTDGSDGMICYTTLDGDLNVAGDWQVQAHVDFGHTEFQSEIHRFTVHNRAEQSGSPESAVTGQPKPRRGRRHALLKEIRRRQKNAVQLGISTEAPEEEIPHNWYGRLRAWLTGPESRSLITSFAFHTVLLIILGGWMLSQISSNDAISLVMSDDNALPFELEEIDLSMQASGAEAETAPQFKKIEQQSTESMLKIPSASSKTSPRSSTPTSNPQATPHTRSKQSRTSPGASADAISAILGAGDDQRRQSVAAGPTS